MRVDKVRVTPSLNFCWYPRPTWEELLTLARIEAESSRLYLQPMPNDVSFFEATHPTLTAVSRVGLTFWKTEAPNTSPSFTLPCKTQSPFANPRAKLFFFNLDLFVSYAIGYPSSQPWCPTTAEPLIVGPSKVRSVSVLTVSKSCLYSVFKTPFFAPVCGENEVSNVSFSPFSILS